MPESTTIVAFDQHAASVMAAVLPPQAAKPATQALGPDLPQLGRFLDKVRRSGPVRCCYEAGPCGFELYRYLHDRGIPCEVIAPGLIPRRPGDRVKTDRRDAAQLAVLARAGALTPIHVPSATDEAARDLVRTREDTRRDRERARRRLGTFLLRHGRRHTRTTSQGYYYDQWVRRQAWPLPTLTATHQHYLRAVDEAQARLQALETDLQALATAPRYAEAVGRLRCFRGIDTLSALILAVELGDVRRFASATALMAFVGLVPAEHSSGPKTRRGGITRTGNTHLRRILVEAAWHYRHQPYRGHLLRRRQAGQPPTVIATAWRAQQRLHRRYRHLIGHGKRPTVAVIAVARELTGFLWASLLPSPDRPGASGRTLDTD